MQDQTVLGDADLTAANIKSGVNIFGVTGTFAGGFPSYTMTQSTTWGSYLTSKNVTGPGLAHVDNGSYSYDVFFKNTLVTDGSGNATIDGISGIEKLRSYSLGSVGVQLKGWRGNGATRANVNVSGPGVAYIEYPGNQIRPYFFASTLTSDGSMNPTLDGVALGGTLQGYSN